MSLRARLLWFLLAAIVLAASGAGVGGLPHGAEGGGRDLRLPHAADGALRCVPACRRVPRWAGLGRRRAELRVRDPGVDGGRRGASSSRPSRLGLPQRAVLGFSDVAARGTTYRVFSLQTRGLVIQVAQDMAARRADGGHAALRTICAGRADRAAADAGGLVGGEPLAGAGGAGARPGGERGRPTIFRRSARPACPRKCGRWCMN